jgi:hypothetical protein
VYPISGDDQSYEEVQLKTLDAFCEVNKIKSIYYLKIDVEGAEIETLKGMQMLLSQQKPDVLIEVNNLKNLKKVKKLFPNEYKVYDIDEDNLVMKKLKWYSKPSKHRNYLLTVKSRKTIRNVFSGEIQ